MGVGGNAGGPNVEWDDQRYTEALREIRLHDEVRKLRREKAKLVAALKDAIPAMEYKLSHLQARQARIDAARVLEQARAVLKEAGEL